MFNLDQFYETLKDYIFENYRHLNPAVVYPYPFGSSDPENVAFESTVDIPETVFLVYDQEPIFENVPFLDYYAKLFDEWGSNVVLITTQQWGVNLNRYVNQYNWEQVYFFFHGVVVQDWFRGYKYNPFILNEPNIKYHFYSLNRLFDGPRPHRRWLLCDMAENNLLEQSLFSFPKHDTHTGRTFLDSCTEYDHLNFNTTQADSHLPLILDDNSQQSFYIESTLAKQCFCNIVTETIFDSKENYITEKTFKPIVLGMPFLILGTPNTLNTLHNYGFETFDNLWKETYDSDVSHHSRYKSIIKNIHTISSWSLDDLKENYNLAKGKIEYNRRHVFSNDFQYKLINELFTNLNFAVQRLTAR